MLFTKKANKKEWNIKEEVLEALDGQEAVVVGTNERTILIGNGGDVAEIILNILNNLENCTDEDFVLSLFSTYKKYKGISSLEDLIDTILKDEKEETPAPKKRGRKPKTEKKEEK